MKTAPINTASELIKNVQDSPTKQIDPKLKRSVTRLFRRKRAKLLKVECDGVELTSDVGSLKRLADTIFLKPAVQQHIVRVQSSTPQCIDCFKTFCIGKAFIGSERYVMLAFFNVFDLLNIVRCVAGDYSVILHGDVTSKASSSAFNSLSFGVNMLCGHCIAWTTALIPAETELGHSHSEVYKAANVETKRILTLPNCGRRESQTCSYIKELNDNQVVTAVMPCDCDANPWRIEKPLGDNNTGFQNFC